MTPKLTIDVFPVGPLLCNCVIVGDEATKTAIVVDPGDEIERVRRALEKRGYTVSAIVATHAHIDHVGGFGELKGLTGAKAFLHEADAPLYDELAMQAQWLGIEPPSTTKLDGPLDERSRLALGKTAFEVRHTPGHSPGSVALVLPEATPILLSGDTLFAGSIGRTDLWGGSFDEIMTSIKSKLLTLPDETIVIPGHGPRTTIGAERKTNPFLV
jgi:hydroxyacylglutathione hydrolase